MVHYSRYLFFQSPIYNLHSSIYNSSMSLDLLILADDLTGAADTATQFAQAGVACAVALGETVPPLHPSISVCAIDTETRHLPPIDAFRKIVSIVKKGRAAGINRFYKKIDSTFRGNVGAELEALLQAAAAHQLLLVPAYPKGGRITRDGCQYVYGKLLHESAFAHDPREPATESYIPSIVSRQTPFPVHCISKAALATFSLANDRRPGIFAFDAENDEDLQKIARQCAKGDDALRIMAGAAGFAGILRESLPFQKKTIAAPTLHDRLFVVNGSLNEVSVEQVEEARRSGTFCVFFDRNLAEKNDPAAVTDALAEQLSCQLNARGKAILSTQHDRLPMEPSACARVLARVTAAVLEMVPDATPAVFGGDTAYAVCRAIGTEVLYPAAEIEAGLTVLSKALRGGMILKSGGFGSRNVIAAIEEYIFRESKGFHG
jgi:D-threonate/D-erythronate kinase